MPDALNTWRRMRREVPGWLLVALTIVALRPLCVWRWRAIGAAPAAWPVGRA